MKTLPIEASDEAILDAVRDWVSLLAQKRYREACAYLHHPSHEPYWRADLIEEAINEYGCADADDECCSVVTPLEDARGGPSPRHAVTRFADPTRGRVWFDLPVNGTWSDLTATLNFKALDNHIVLELNDIHVM